MEACKPQWPGQVGWRAMLLAVLCLGCSSPAFGGTDRGTVTREFLRDAHGNVQVKIQSGIDNRSVIKQSGSGNTACTVQSGAGNRTVISQGDDRPGQQKTSMPRGEIGPSRGQSVE